MAGVIVSKLLLPIPDGSLFPEINSAPIRCVFLAFVICSMGAAASLDANGWHIDADTKARTLVIRHEGVGTLLENVQLGVQDHAAVQPIQQWIAAETNGNLLTIRTDSPSTAWEFDASENLLKISTTAVDGMLTAKAPAPATRIPARTLDPGGIPVMWQGTLEVANKYDGAVTRNPSYLPRTDPDAMYFALGQVSGEQFHSLFDRATDTAIEFSDATLLERDASREDALVITMPVPGNAVVRLLADYYRKHLGVPFYVPFDDSHFKSAPMVWSSWTSYYDAVSEADIVRNADWISVHLKPYGFQYVELDDGYDRSSTGEHTWIGPWDKQKFPHGPEWLTAYIKSKGLRAGLWLVPNAYAGAVESHPGWYLHYKDGKIVLDYATPTLDSTNPDVGGFLKVLFTTLDNWGFDYYKFDGEFAAADYIPGVDRSKLYKPSADFVANYRDRLKIIRQTLGPDRFVEGCPAGTPLNGIGYFNSYFNGEDLYNNWQGMHSLFTAISGNAFLNHLVVYVMPGEGLELGEQMTVEEAAKKRPPVVIQTARTRESPMSGFGMTLSEARTLVSYISLTGVAYPLASVMPELSEERVQLLKATLPTLPILPMDLFSRGTNISWDTFKHTTANNYIQNYPDLLDLKVSNTLGSYDVVALTNWRGQKASRELHFKEQLGLPAKATYLAFDFWNRQFLGAFQDSLNVDVESHDTRVLLVSRELNRPQVLGSSRHLSGGYSLENVSWTQNTHSLTGTALTVPNDPYSIWVHVPSGTRSISVSATVPVTQRIDGDLLTLTFTGVKTPVKWQASFGD